MTLFKELFIFLAGSFILYLFLYLRVNPCNPAQFDVTENNGAAQYSAFTGEEAPTFWIFHIDQMYFQCRVARITIDTSCARDYFTGKDWACRYKPPHTLTKSQVASAVSIHDHTISVESNY